MMDNKEVTTDFETRRPRQSSAPLIVTVILLVAALCSAGALGYFWTQEKAKIADLQQQLEVQVAEVTELQQQKADLGTALDEQRNEIDRIKKEWSDQVAKLKKEQQKRMERTYAKMNGIVYDSRKTLEYISVLEDKLKAGESLDEKEAKDLDAIISGLVVLHEQYKKPIHEFSELEAFLSEQLQLQGAVPPNRKLSFFKRIFSKDYRKAEESFIRDQGRREAFETARNKVVQAYSRAQAAMDKVSLNSGKYLDQLQQIVGSNKAAASEVAEFFEKSKEILKIHDKIMSIEPEKDVKAVKP
ncbi:MAG: hypothetical protein L3J39_01155 [Verrucomicrobiales bacterium]|nr:hypothetical protein [Verrucomicrobiales bacterium]